MNFQSLHERLVMVLLERVQNGEITERGMARKAGISQPHIHNVLKGKRLLSWVSADILLSELNLDVGELLRRPTTDE